MEEIKARLSQPKVLQIIQEYSGCKPWVNLDEELFLEEAKLVLSDNNLNQIVEKITLALKQNY